MMKSFITFLLLGFSSIAFATEDSLYVRGSEGLVDVGSILEDEPDVHGFDNYCYKGDAQKVIELMIEWHDDEWFFAGGGGNHILEDVGVNNWYPHDFIFAIFRSEVTGELQIEYFNHCSQAKEDKPMSQSIQDQYMAEVAKQQRRRLWQSGHDDVASSIEYMSKEKLDDYVKQENNLKYETPLTKEEIAELYMCHHSNAKRGCRVYLIGLSGSYMGGYGELAVFVMLNTKKRTHKTISHMVYAE